MGDLTTHFSRHEFACKCGCGFDTVDVETLLVLEDIHDWFGNKPITINSGCRCAHHNRKEGGAARSQHVKARGVDFVVKDVHADEVADYLEEKYPNKYGIGRYNGRTHIDTRTGSAARWDKRK